MAVKGIKFSEVKAKALANPDVKKAYDEATQEEELRAKSARLAELDAKLNLDRPAAQAEKKKAEQER